jgi:DNA ligase (NAD+)
MGRPLTNPVKIVERLHEAKEAYYKGKPIMSDADFDTLEDRLKELDPKNEYFKVVGAPVAAGNVKEKVEHQVPMLSCGKAKTFADVEAWAKKVGADKEMFCVQPKIDGMSGNCVYEDGKLVQIATRGDGHIGQDVTHLSHYINVPKTIDIKGRVEIRGEIYLPKDTKAPNPDNKPLRNICVGMVGRKDHKLDDLKFVHFVAYQVVGSSLLKRESDKMLWLHNSKFEIADWRCMKLDELEAYRQEYVDTLRSKWQYETDGLVIVVNDNTKWAGINSLYEVSHHNHYNIAWKPESETAETTLENIEWQVTRSGRLTPVAIFKPIVLGGATITRASLTCYDNVLRMKMEKGDKLLVSRANDVIPYIEQNLTKKVAQR